MKIVHIKLVTYQVNFQQNTKSLIFSNVNAYLSPITQYRYNFYLFTSNDENTRYSKGKQLAPKQNKIKMIENPNSLLPSKPYIFKTQHNNVKVTVVL